MKPYALLVVLLILLNVGMFFAFRASASPASRTEPAGDEASSMQLATLERRVEALGDENRSLRDRLSLIEGLPVPEAVRREPVAAFVTKEEFEAFRGEVERVLAQRLGQTEVAASTPEFKEKIASALSEIRHQEAVDQVRSKQEARLAELDETILPKIENWLQLTPHQTGEMRTALLDKYERDNDLIRRWEAGEDDEVLGELKSANREAHRVDLAYFLSEEQLETYWSRGSGK